MSHYDRIGAVLVTAVMLCVVSSAGVLAQPSFEFGVKFGLGMAKLTGDDAETIEVIDNEPFEVDGEIFYLDGKITDSMADMKTGFVAGAYATAHITEQLGVRLEALYFKKGGKGDISGKLDVYDEFGSYILSVDVKGENTVTLDYFEIPILGVVSFPVSTMGTFDLFAGPAFAFNTKAEAESDATMCVDGDCIPLYAEKEDIKKHVKSLDFGGVLGAGFTLNLEQVVLFGEARWTYGFTEFLDIQDLDPGDKNPDLKNSAFGIMVGVGIPLAKTP